MELDPRLHFVVATAVVVKPRTGPAQGDATAQGRPFEYLITKRAPHEKAFPNLWTVPGGKLVVHEYRGLPKTVAAYAGWYNITEWLVRKEVREEVGLEIHPPHYVTDLVFIRPDGYPALILSYWAAWKSGEVKLCQDLTEHAWVTLAEAGNYDLIEGVLNELRQVDDILKKTQGELS